MATEQKQHAPPTEKSLLEKVGVGGMIRIMGAVMMFVIMTFFYTMLPIAGLQLLPFLFFGCISLIVGVCDDLGVYR